MRVLYVVTIYLSLCDAARVTKNKVSQQSILQNDAASSMSLMPEVQAMLQEMSVNQCVYTLINNYAKIIGPEAVEQGKAAAKDKIKSDHSYSEMRLLIENGVVMKEQFIDVLKYPSCTVGMPLLPCFDSLGPMDLLKQRLTLEDLIEAHSCGHHGHGHCDKNDTSFNEAPVVAAHELFRQSMKAMNFSVSRGKVYCYGEAKKPLQHQVRTCMLETAEGNITRWGFLNEKFEVETKIKTLEAMASRWYDFRRSRRSKSTKGFKELVEELRSLDVKIYGAAGSREAAAERKKCEQDADPARLISLKTRIFDELTSACNPATDCHETYGKVSPSGYACDFQKAFTPERAVLGLFAGEFATWGLYPAVGYTLGMMIGGPTAAAHWATASFLMPHFPTDAILSAFFASKLSRAIFPTCQAFPLECDRNEKDGVCEMRAGTQTTRASSNPFAHMPMDGFKCAPASDEANSPCQLQICSGMDVKESVAVNGKNFKLFGRVGRINGGTYNCANTKGSPRSMLGTLDSLPSASSDRPVKNTVENRNALLALYPGVADVPSGLKSASEEAHPTCTEEAKVEIEQKYRILDSNGGSRFKVACAGRVVTDENQYDASCSREDCDGRSWCFVKCKLLGGCVPQPAINCD